MKTVSLISVFLGLLPIASLAATSPDPCVKEGAPTNSWIMTVNVEDAATREDLLNSLRILGTGGFQVRHLFAENDAQPITFAMSFDPNYWGGGRRADEVKDNALRSWQLIRSNAIQCEGTKIPSPGIGVTN